MEDSVRKALSPVLHDFVRGLARQNIIPSLDMPEAVADLFREFFQIPCPMLFSDASDLISQVKYENVFLQPGLLAQKHIRGYWQARQAIMKIIIDASRIKARNIKTLLHELSEHILVIGYDLHPSVPELSIKKRERWANRFAAMIKMPPEHFLEDVELLGLDHQALKDKYEDTLAGVSRQIRDLKMEKKSYYYCRFELENHPERNCPSLLSTLEKSNGICVRISDAVKTDVLDINRRRGGGALPFYNVGIKDEYRVLNPEFRRYLSQRKTVYIPRLRGAAGYEETWHDLYGDNDLAILLYHYGHRRTRGFFLIGVHPSDVCLLDKQRQNMVADYRNDIEWVFSWAFSRYSRVHDELDDEENPQPELPELYEDMENEQYRWPCSSDIDGQGELFRGKKQDLGD